MIGRGFLLFLFYCPSRSIFSLNGSFNLSIIVIKRVLLLVLDKHRQCCEKVDTRKAWSSGL